jgi:hypothetical protein
MEAYKKENAIEEVANQSETKDEKKKLRYRFQLLRRRLT